MIIPDLNAFSKTKKILKILCLGLISIHLLAQNQEDNFKLSINKNQKEEKENKTYFGIKAGYLLSNIRSAKLVLGTPKHAFALGGYVNIPLSEKFSFQPELLYSLQGTSSTPGDRGEGVSLNYINTPMMFKWLFHSDGYVELGPYLSYTADDRYWLINNHDFGMALGAGFYWEDKNLGFNLRITRGFVDITRLDYSQNAYNITMFFGLLYRIKSRK